MTNPITGNLDYMNISLTIMSRVKELIDGLHFAYTNLESNSPDVAYVINHKDEMIDQLLQYRDQIASGHEIVDSIKLCLENEDVRNKFFTKDVSKDDLLDLLDSNTDLVNSTIEAFNTSIELLNDLNLVDKDQLIIEKI